MSKLVRARVKAVEDMPEWTKCCPEMLEYINVMRGHELTAVLGSEFVADEVECGWCHRIAYDRRYVRSTSGQPFSLELYDLDEVPPELQSD